MKLFIRDLTEDRDLEITVPYTEDLLTKDHEYIILDQQDVPVKLSEYDNIAQLNSFLLKIQESGYSEDALKAIGNSYLYSEIIEAFKKDDDPFVIIEVESTDDSDLGYALYEIGVSYFPFKMPKGAEDYIRWEQNWYAADSDGWRKVSDGNDQYYIVKKF